MSYELTVDPHMPFITSYGPSGILLWYMASNVMDLNGQTYAWLPWHNFQHLFKNYPDADIVLNQITVNWYNKTSGAAPGKLIELAMIAGHNGGQSILYLDMASSGTLVTKLHWQGNIPVNQWKLDFPGFGDDHVAIYLINPAADMTTTDDELYLVIEGSVIPCPTSPDRSTPQAVSLEGYKWPLIRR